MKRERHGTEEIIRKLRDAEQLESTGQSVAQVCQKLEISGSAVWHLSAGLMGRRPRAGRSAKAIESKAAAALVRHW